MVIPESWHDDRIFWEKLRQPVTVRRDLHSTTITFLIEPPRDDCVHACTVDDVLTVLRLLPARDRLLVKTFIFRQPSRKQEILASCWGRMAYSAGFGRSQGVAIFLEAQAPDRPLFWPRSQDPPGLQELARLRLDGHRVERKKRRYEIRSSIEAIRNTQLLRTLPHEMGHYVHYLLALEKGMDHWSRTRREKEQFADRYAEQFSARARQAGLIPFPRQLDMRRLSMDGLRPSWFGPRVAVDAARRNLATETR